ncbi:MAG: serine protein kinase RIO [Nitrososphaera sp.]|jgi:RIO kinase 1
MLSDDLQKKFTRKINIRLTEKDREKKSQKNGFDKNKVLNEVFDKSTTMLLSEMINDGIIAYVNGAVGSGKESKTFWAIDPSKKDLAIKIYLVTTSNFKKRAPYLIGDPRFSRIKKGTRSMVEIWAQKEFSNLKQCFDSGIPCPEPITQKKNVLVMRFIGENGVPSPTLVESEVDYQDYEQVLKIICDLYTRAKIIHSDLSEYNIFKTKKGLTVFDFGSAVDIRHPNAKDFLERDIKNMTKFFARRGLTVQNPIDVLGRIVR